MESEQGAHDGAPFHNSTKQRTSIKAIETSYAGHRFRSRLEARWAVFFDALNIRWDYEPQGYHLAALPAHLENCLASIGISSEPCDCLADLGPYLPDFLLHSVDGHDLWFEVKGEGGSADGAKVFRLEELTGIGAVLAVGSIPDPNRVTDRWTPGLTISRSYDWESHCWCACSEFGTVGIQYEGRSDRLRCPCPEKRSDRGHAADHPRILDAYAAARSARFEHGESGPRAAR